MSILSLPSWKLLPANEMCRKLFSAINFQTFFLVIVCWFCGTPNIIKMTVFRYRRRHQRGYPVSWLPPNLIHFQFGCAEKRFTILIFTVSIVIFLSSLWWLFNMYNKVRKFQNFPSKTMEKYLVLKMLLFNEV